MSEDGHAHGVRAPLALVAERLQSMGKAGSAREHKMIDPVLEPGPRLARSSGSASSAAKAFPVQGGARSARRQTLPSLASASSRTQPGRPTRRSPALSVSYVHSSSCDRRRSMRGSPVDCQAGSRQIPRTPEPASFCHSYLAYSAPRAASIVAANNLQTDLDLPPVRHKAGKIEPCSVRTAARADRAETPCR